MNISFSTKGWEHYSFDELCAVAVEQNFGGIEIHSITTDEYTGERGIFCKEKIASTYRALMEQKLCVPCLDVSENLLDDSRHAQAISEITNCILIAKEINCPYIRCHAFETETVHEKETTETTDAAIATVIEAVKPLAEENGVTLLFETMGVYADTARLRDLLNRFSCDCFAALWDVHYTVSVMGEDPADTIKLLGAYVRHIHIKDSRLADGARNYVLMGEGDLPVDAVMNCLRSINYDGFISLEWDPTWFEELNDIDIVLPQFASYIGSFDDPSKNQKAFFYNKRHTGKFVWKKDVLIEKTFPQVLDRMVEDFPDQLAFKYTTLDYTRTYAQFREDVDTFARALISMGVKAGHHVAVWATNVPQWYIAFWATTKIGAVLVTMNTAYKIHEAEYLLSQSDTHTLIMVNGFRDSDYVATVNELCPELQTMKSGEQLHCKRLPFLRNVITVGFSMPGGIAWEDAVKRAESVSVEEVYRRAARVNIHDVCNMQYTSGTTGFPKGVMLTHYNIVNNGKCIGDRMDLSTADRMMIQVPMFHCFGMVLAMTATMTHGGTLLPLPYFSPKPALACVNQERITCFHGVPTMFIAMLEHPDFVKTDFSYMRTGIMAGSPCPVPVMQDVLNKMNMTEITIVYGQTESSPGCTMSSTDDSLETRVSTVGRPLPEIECKIVDPETGMDLPDGETGEFVARGYNIMKGYYKMPKATQAAIDKDGWLHTGDLAVHDPDDNYRITGRLKDMIIRGGENIYPKEIEEFIYTHPKVKDVQVIGVPDKQYGEEIMACIVLKDGETVTVEEMKQYILEHMARHKVPRYIDFVSGFPMNVAGKILKYKMREDAIKRLGIQL